MQCTIFLAPLIYLIIHNSSNFFEFLQNMIRNIQRVLDFQVSKPQNSATLGRSMSVRGTRTTPETKSNSDHGTRTKITSGLMNSLSWARPFRKSCEEDGKVVTKSMTRRDADSLSPRSSHQYLSAGNQPNVSRARNITNNSRVAPLASNLGTSNSSLKRSTSSVSSLTPTKVSSFHAEMIIRYYQT